MADSLIELSCVFFPVFLCHMFIIRPLILRKVNPLIILLLIPCLSFVLAMIQLVILHFAWGILHADYRAPNALAGLAYFFMNIVLVIIMIMVSQIHKIKWRH